MLTAGTILFFVKGNPNHDRLGRFARAPSGSGGGGSPATTPSPILPSSSYIQTKEEAEAYWHQHIAGRTLHLTVSAGGVSFEASVIFDSLNKHVWTRRGEDWEKADAYDRPDMKEGKRVFVPGRARTMDRLFRTIEDPSKIVRGKKNRYVYLSSAPIHGQAGYTVVLEPVGKATYNFVTALPMSSRGIASLAKKGEVVFPPDDDSFHKSETPPRGGVSRSSSTRIAGRNTPNPLEFCSNAAAVASTGEDRLVVAGVCLDDFFSFFKAIPPGARWITVRPNGPGTEGQPVLIQPEADGAARVIGGAGGKLNYLKLTGVRSEADYKAEAHAKLATRKEEKARQRERDKADGLTENKAAAKEALRDQVSHHQAQFVSAVADALGWRPEDLRFPEERYQNASPAAVKKAAEAHGRALFQKAREAVDHQRQVLLNDAEARAAGGLGEVPLTSSDPSSLTVQDLDPIAPATKGLGYTTDYGARAEAAGLTKEALADEAAAAKPTPDPAKAEAAGARKATAEKVSAELKAIRDPLPQVDPIAKVDARKAVEMLKAEKALKAVLRDARDKKRQIEGARTPVEPTAYVIETGGPVDHDVVRDLESDLRTIRTRAFLEEVGRVPGGADAIGRHVGVGAYNSINALALAAGGASLVDRSVVDVLGVAGAAQVLARRLQADLTPEEMEQARDAMQNFHVDHYMETSESALREARELHEMAQEIELGEAATGADLAAAQEMNAKRRDFTAKAQAILGTSLGEMEANAALVVALKQRRKDKIEVSLGKASIEDGIRQARAIGLQRGEYQIERIGASTMMTVTGSGMDRLAQPVSREDLQRTRGALDIIEGRADEDGWLPDGVARRPEMAMNIKPGTAPQIAKPFAKAPRDVEAAIRDYIGGRAADGDAPADIMQGLLSEDTLQRAGDRGAFMAALDRIAPLYDADGKMVRVEAHKSAFDRMADEYVGKMGGDLTPIQRQQFQVDHVAVEALHQALAAHPDGVAAFKPIGELTPQDQGALRAAFAKEYGRADPEAEAMRAELEKLDAAAPEREVEDMFGRGTNPRWTDWKAKRDALAEKLNAASMTWGKYLDVMGSPANAYAAMQDVIKGRVLNAFAEHHNTLRPDKPLKVGRTVIAHDLNHLDALDPKARARREADRRQLADSLRNRVAGRYAAGGVAEKLDAARAAEEAASQSQMGLFGTTDEPKAEAAQPARPIEMGERHTIGHQAERQIAGMMPIVGSQFRPGQRVEMWRPDMSGKYVGRQRAVKLIEHNGRTELGMGVGSGKTSIMLSAFTHMKSKGKAKRGLFVVPSIVQGQFHGEALTLLEPGRFNWHCDPSASREERIAAYKDPKVDFSVVTHQALRDDLLHLAAKQESVTPAAIADKMDAMKPEERKAFMRRVLDAEGIDHDYLAVDEGHNLLNRQGKENSRLANVVDSVSDNMPTYVSATADPVKNDASEAFDVLSKMDRARYHDRDAFMRKYGVDTAAAREGLRREMARHFYTGKIDPGVDAQKREISVPLDDSQKARLKAIGDAAARGRIARMKGAVDVEAMRTLSPNSFADADPAQHEAIAKSLQASIGIIHNSAVLSAMNGGAKTEALAKLAAERKGKPGVVFAHSLAAVHEAADRLTREGHRVVVLTGADSPQEKDRKKREYRDGQHDIIVCSDAGAVGANLQRGQWLCQYDTPATAMTHAQRNGRIHRIGQKNNVELMDLVADHPAERRERKRLAQKYALRDIMTSPMEGLDDRGIAGYLNQVRSGKAQAETPMHMPSAPEDAAGLEDERQGGLF